MDQYGGVMNASDTSETSTPTVPGTSDASAPEDLITNSSDDSPVSAQAVATPTASTPTASMPTVSGGEAIPADSEPSLTGESLDVAPDDEMQPVSSAAAMADERADEQAEEQAKEQAKEQAEEQAEERDPSIDQMSSSDDQSSGQMERTGESPEAKNDGSDQPKKTRAPRTPKVAAPKAPEGGGSVGAIVERVVRLSALGEIQIAALGRLLNVGLPDDQIARLTRLTTASLGPSGTSGNESLATVLGLESANPIHVGVQLGRLAPTALPDVYRCVFALTGQTAPSLPRGDSAVFAVADALATLSTDEFVLARALTSALE